MALKTLDLSLKVIRVLQDGTDPPEQALLLPGWYVDPQTGQRIFYDPNSAKFYTMAGGVYIPLGYMNPAPKQVAVAPGDRLRVTISFKYTGPDPDHYVQEMADLTFLAFDLADRYRNPMAIMADGMLGQMMEPLEWKPLPVNSQEKSWALTAAGGRPRNIVLSAPYTDAELMELNRVLAQKYRRIAEAEQRWEYVDMEGAEASIASYPDIVRRELTISDDWIVVCGMAMGYADPDAVVNTFQPPRIALEEYAVFLD